MKRPRHSFSDQVEAMCAEALNDVYMERARRMLRQENPEIALFAASMQDAWYELVGRPSVENLVLDGEYVRLPDPTPKALAEAMAPLMERNRTYLERAQAEQ